VSMNLEYRSDIVSYSSPRSTAVVDEDRQHDGYLLGGDEVIEGVPHVVYEKIAVLHTMNGAGAPSTYCLGT